MPTTYYQTAVRVDKTPGKNEEPTYELSCAPIAPPGKRKIYYEDGSYTHWLNGEVYHVTPDNIWTIWYQKPTLAQAVKPHRMASYYEFRKDGSVTHRYKDEGYTMEFHWWSTPLEKDAETYDTEFDPDFVKCRNCGSNAEGSDWELHGLCSRDCMKESIGYDSLD